MKFSLLILGAPYTSQSMHTALRFANASIESEHSIYRVFFYHDGINAGNNLITPAQDELNVPEEWARLAKTHNIDLVVCIASALKRGVLNSQEAERYEKTSQNLHESFDISGLGQLVDAMIISDRIVSFGP